MLLALINPHKVGEIQPVGRVRSESLEHSLGLLASVLSMYFSPKPLKDFCTSTGLFTCLQETIFVGKRRREDSEASHASRW